MESFYRSCENHLTYPQNLVAQDLPTHTLQAHYDRLEKRSELLFDEHEAAVDFWDLKRGENGKSVTFRKGQSLMVRINRLPTELYK